MKSSCSAISLSRKESKLASWLLVLVLALDCSTAARRTAALD